MPLFYSGQTDYISKLNLVGNQNIKTAITAASAGTYNLDLALSGTFYVTVTAGSAVALTFAVLNKPVAGTPFEITLYIRCTTAFIHTITWPTTTYWISAPAISGTANRTYVYKLMTNDGGTVWHGSIIGQGYTA
jgi:hypothetical protein